MQPAFFFSYSKNVTLALLLLSVLWGCAGTPRALRPAAPQSAERTWLAYVARSDQPVKPAAVSASVRYKLPGENGNRANLTLWSNGAEPYRADVSAGFNSIVARLLETGDRLDVYVPSERTLYTHAGPNPPGLTLGRTMPFTARDLIALLLGRYAQVFGVIGENPVRDKDGNSTYTLAGTSPVTRQSRLTLDAQGLPVFWRQAQPDGWRLRLEYPVSASGAPALPEQITLCRSDGYEAVITVKSRTYPEAAFRPERLRLAVPPGTGTRPLR